MSAVGYFVWVFLNLSKRSEQLVEVKLTTMSGYMQSLWSLRFVYSIYTKAL